MQSTVFGLAVGAFLLFTLGAVRQGRALSPPSYDFYVAPNGADANPGTADKPFATVVRARDAVRALRKQASNRDLKVMIEAGVYRLDGPLEMSAEDSGCTYVGEPGKTILSGGRVITGLVAGLDGLWTVRIPDAQAGRWDVNELFVNGRRRPRARHPNEGYLRVEKAGSDNRTGFMYEVGDLDAFKSLTGAQLVFLHDWCTSRVPIASVDRPSRTLKTAAPIGANMDFMAISGFEPHPRYFIENARELLDAPGEWFLDRQAGLLTYMPMPGETPDKAEVVVPATDRLLTIAGDLKQRDAVVKGLSFHGMTFEHCRFNPPAGGYAASQAGFHETRDAAGKRLGGWSHMPAAIELANAEDVRFTECTVRNVGGSGLRVGRGCRAVRIERGVVEDVGGNGVMIGQDAHPVRDNVVTGCRIRRCGQTYVGCVGVWAGLAAGTVVEHNEISELPYSGVSVGWSWNTNPTQCQGNLVQNNHIHRVMQTLSDGGGIYTLGLQPGTVLRGNRIHDIPANAGRAESNGMFIDEGSSRIRIEGNTIWNVARSSIRFHKATDNTIAGNVLVCPTGVPPFRFNACRAEQMTFANNRTPDPAAFQPPTSQADAPDQ